MSFDNLTERQKQVYLFIESKILTQGYGPTVREICEHFDIKSPNGVVCHLKALERKGLIKRASNKSRAIQLVGYHKPKPALRYVDENPKSVSQSNNQSHIDFNEVLGCDNQDHFVIKINGDSLVDASIQQGDLVVVNPKHAPKEGQLVVTELADGSRIVKYWQDQSEFRNQVNGMATAVRAENLLGVVIALVRELA